MQRQPTFYEFFAGGGMARAGLGRDWRCLFANDFDAKKGLSYQANWGTGGELKISDVSLIRPADLPEQADLAWASFPCQDLSLAGGGAGLKGRRSGTFHVFWNIIEELVAGNRAPSLIALENVCGTLTSHGGKDYQAICASLVRSGYRIGALVVDAALFVPQSRPRLFVVGVRRSVDVDRILVSSGPIKPFHSDRLCEAFEKLESPLREAWLWWNLPAPPWRNSAFADLIEDIPFGVDWHSEAETSQLIRLMSPVNLAKLVAAKRAGRRMVGGVYRRTRLDARGEKVQRAEVRFDDIAGCLRTPAGGSSRQTILVVDGDLVRSRLISARETARLMGLSEDYRLPRNYNEAYHLTGDGVVAPVVRHLAAHLFEPLLGRSVERPLRAVG